MSAPSSTPIPHAGTPLDVQVEVLPHGRGIELPRYETEGAAGMDLRAAIAEPIDLQPLERRAVPTGLRLRIPSGWEGQVRPRSGLALKQGLSMPNSPGTIDSDYRGELQVLLINLSPSPLTITPGQRIAQLVFCPVGRAVLRTVVHIEEDTARGKGGFGSTGT